MTETEYSGTGHYEAAVVRVRDMDDRIRQSVASSIETGEQELGCTLGALRDRLGGDSGSVKAPDGGRLTVSIADYKAGPADTRVVVRYRFIPDDPEAHDKWVKDLIARHRADDSAP